MCHMHVLHTFILVWILSHTSPDKTAPLALCGEGEGAAVVVSAVTRLSTLAAENDPARPRWAFHQSSAESRASANRRLSNGPKWSLWDEAVSRL